MPAIGTWRYPIRAYNLTKKAGSSECNASCLYGTRASFHHKNSFAGLFSRPSNFQTAWIHMPGLFLACNKVWMDECTAKSDPLADQYNNPIHQQRIFAIETYSFQPDHVLGDKIKQVYHSTDITVQGTYGSTKILFNG